MRKIIAASAVAVSLAVTSGTAVAINQSSSPSIMRSASASPTTAPSQSPSVHHGPGGRQSVLSDSLKKLVVDGTITQAQAEAILAEVAAERKAQVGTFKNHAKRGFAGGAMRILHGATASVAKSIGITPDELRAELETGKSIADIAIAHGVDPATVVASLESEANAHIDALVTKGTLTADQASKLKSGLNPLVENLMNGKGPGSNGFGRGLGRHRDDSSAAPNITPGQAPTSPAPSSSAPSTPAPTVAPPTSAVPTTTGPATTVAG